MAVKRRVLLEEHLRELFVFMVAKQPLQKITTPTKQKAAQHFSLPIQLVSSWVRRWKARDRTEPGFYINSNLLLQNLAGAKPKFSGEDLVARIKALPSSDRRSLDRMAAAIGASKCTITRHCKGFTKKKINNRTVLTEKARVNRVVHCLWAVQGKLIATGPTDPSEYLVHVDEKPFYRQKTFDSLWLFDDEDENKFARPGPTTETRCPKLQFIAAVGKPIPEFNGKLGIWPMAETVSVVVVVACCSHSTHTKLTHKTHTQTHLTHTFTQQHITTHNNTNQHTFTQQHKPTHAHTTTQQAHCQANYP